MAQISEHPGHYGGTASIGNNPTFDDVNERRVEVYLHDFDASVYGCEINIRLIQHLRPMQRFSGIDELIAQTTRDVAASRAILAGFGFN